MRNLNTALQDSVAALVMPPSPKRKRILGASRGILGAALTPDHREGDGRRARRAAPGNELRSTPVGHKHLSEAGREVLEMMDYTSRNSGLSIADAYVEASATTSLSERDKDITEAYLARRTLIEAFSEETVGEE